MTKEEEVGGDEIVFSFQRKKKQIIMNKLYAIVIASIIPVGCDAPIYDFEVRDIYFVRETLTIEAGSTDTLEYMMAAGNYHRRTGEGLGWSGSMDWSGGQVLEVLWSSSDTNVASAKEIPTGRDWGYIAPNLFTGKAVITGKKAGNAIIGCVTKFGGKKATCSVIIVEKIE